MNRATPKILYVEDNLTVAQAYRSVLERAQYSVKSCSDGEAALQLLQTGLYHMVILDLMLPKKDGLEVLREAQQILWGHRTPVIVFSNVDLSSVKDAALKFGAIRFLTKETSTPHDLLKAVQESFDNPKTQQIIDNLRMAAPYDSALNNASRVKSPNSGPTANKSKVKAGILRFFKKKPAQAEVEA